MIKINYIYGEHDNGGLPMTSVTHDLILTIFMTESNGRTTEIVDWERKES